MRFDTGRGTSAAELVNTLDAKELTALFKQYGGASDAQQLQIIHKIEKLMVDNLPFIPTTEGVDWYQYDTTKIGGWPTQSDQYAQPSPYSFPDNGQVVTHLYPTG